MQPSESRPINVDGELFDVFSSDEEPGQRHLTWRSRPNPGYGYSCRRSDGEAFTKPQLIDQVRDFLEHIDTATGYSGGAPNPPLVGRSGPPVRSLA